MITRRDVLGGALAAALAQTVRLEGTQTKGLNMPGPYQSRTISVTVNRSHQEAYNFASRPENMHKWASGLSSQPLEKADDQWIAETPDGPMRVRFAERNVFGVLDHYVIRPNGETIYLPVRVIANGSGCDIAFTFFRRPGISDDEFDRDANWVSRDLGTLKKLLESPTA